MFPQSSNQKGGFPACFASGASVSKRAKYHNFGFFFILVRWSWGHFWQTVFTPPAVSLFLLGYIDRADEVIDYFDCLCFGFTVAYFLAHLYPIDKRM